MVSFVIISHSKKLAEGIVELAAQMADKVVLIAAGGSPDGGIGTDVELIKQALDKAKNPDGTVIMADLGSAIMSAEVAMEDFEGTCKIGDGPIVEGTVMGAVQASLGMDLDTVLGTIKESRQMPK